LANIILPNVIPDNRRKLDEWKTKRLKSGMHLPEYRHVAIPEYWKRPHNKRPQSLQELAKLARPHACLWEFENWDAHTGEVFDRMVAENIITDNGAYTMLQVWGNVAPSFFNHVVVSPNGCSTKTTVATGTSPITSISVNALTVSLASGRQLTLGYNGATPQVVTLSAIANVGATTLTVTSFTPSVNFPINTDICAIPLVTDNPSSVSSSVDSGALGAGAFTAPSGSGLGSRIRPVSATITGTTGNAGTYTEGYSSSNGTIGTGTTGSHVIIPRFVLNSSANEAINLQEAA
jgi:hypothetical protein